MESICHRDRVPAVCSTGRDQVIPCGPFCPGQAHPAPFSQGSGRGGSWLRCARLGGTGPCSAMGSQLHCPWSRSARGAEGGTRGPWLRERGSPELSCALGRVGAAPCPVWVAWGEGGRSCVLPASCGMWHNQPQKGGHSPAVSSA